MVNKLTKSMINVKSALCSTTVVVVSPIHLAAAVAVEVVAVADGGRRRTNVISVVSIFFSFALNVCACRPGAHVYCKKMRGRPIHNSLYISRCVCVYANVSFNLMQNICTVVTCKRARMMK